MQLPNSKGAHSKPLVQLGKAMYRRSRRTMSKRGHQVCSLTARQHSWLTIERSQLLHSRVPMWGWVASLSFVVSGGLLAAFFMWRRDIIANIIAHVLTDVVGIAFAHLR